jgi:hypothetical protein
MADLCLVLSIQDFGLSPRSLTMNKRSFLLVVDALAVMRLNHGIPAAPARVL